MLIRITQNSAGIEHYFESGKKIGRCYSRDELDTRVHLAGSLIAFSAAVSYTTKNKKWKEHYWHITASFAFEDNNLNDDTLREITHDLLSYYYPNNNPNDLIVAAEAHKPKIQSELNKSTKTLEQRLLHIHLAVSKLDTVTDTQVRMIPFKLEADKAFQSHLAKKYKLIDPADCSRAIPITKATIISRWHNNGHDPINKQTQVSEVRNGFSQLLANVASLDAAIALLKHSDLVAHVVFKQKKSGNNYLQVKTTVGTRNINLRGRGFENLEAFYYTADELNPCIGNPIIKNPIHKYRKDYDNDNTSYENTYERHKHWWLNQETKRKKSKPINYQAVEKRYEEKFTERLKEARVYYVLYQHNIDEHLIQGYQIWEKNNTRFLFNNDLGVKIYDQPNKITLQMPNDLIKRQNAITLMLEMAKAKGWDINNLKITGSDDFKAEVLMQVGMINECRHQILPQIVASVSKPKLEKTQKIKLNSVDQAINDNECNEAQALSKERVALIKSILDVNVVLDYAGKNLGLISSHFSVTDDNKIDDNRLKSRPKNGIDFLTKTCNLRFSDTLFLLNKFLDEQTTKKDERLNQQYKDENWRPQ